MRAHCRKATGRRSKLNLYLLDVVHAARSRLFVSLSSVLPFGPFAPLAGPEKWRPFLIPLFISNSNLKP